MWPFKKRAAPAAAAMGSFTLNAQLAGSSGRSMQIQGYIYDGESAESLNSRLDILDEVIERRRARAEIPELEAKREQMVKGLSQAAEVLADLEKRQKAGESLTTNERQQIGNMRVNIARVDEELKKGDAAIQETKRKAGVG